jgi:pimeloyl-ACP methyl ester carboxylesterase
MPEATIQRDWVSLESPTMPTAGHGSNPCHGLYHHVAGERPKVAFIATHYNIDFSEHYLAPYLASRGYGFLGWNTRYRGNEAYVLIDNALIDIGVGVRWLREEAGVETVVLLGNSGGGSLMAAYQSQALDPNIQPAPGLKLHPAALELLPGDLYVAVNAHPGRPDILTGWMDPSVVDEADPLSVDPELDLFADGREAPYDRDFVARYRAAQVARNERITDWAYDELDRMAKHGAGDRVFNIHRVYADPRFVDLTLDPSERKPGCYAGDPRRANYGPLGLGRTSTLRSWLSMWSLRDAQCNGAQHLPRVTVPSLVIQSLGDRGVYPSDAQAIHDALGGTDKRIELLPGEHYFETGGRDESADLIAGWLQDHHT